MTFHLTHSMIEGAYELLRTSPPFKAWKLPAPDEVSFVVTRDKATVAEHWVQGETHYFGVSQNCVGTLSFLIVSMAHEMIHMKEFIDGVRNDIKHGASFKRIAKRVCRIHGFDEKSF